MVRLLGRGLPIFSNLTAFSGSLVSSPPNGAGLVSDFVRSCSTLCLSELRLEWCSSHNVSMGSDLISSFSGFLGLVSCPVEASCIFPLSFFAFFLFLLALLSSITPPSGLPVAAMIMEEEEEEEGRREEEG